MTKSIPQVKAIRKPKEHGTNIRAPRLFEDGECVLFIQRIHGLSMTFGRGVIERTLDLPTGYNAAQGTRVQYTIKGTRLFLHEGQATKDRGTYNTWLGSTVVVIVPRTEKNEAWLEERAAKWKSFLATYNELLKEMKICLPKS